MENPKNIKKEIDLPHTPDPPQIINPSSLEERNQKKKPITESKIKPVTKKKPSKKTDKKTVRKKR